MSIVVFPAREGLYRYLAWKNDADVDGKVVVELAGEIGDDCDLDAEMVRSIRNRTGEEDE